MFGAVVAPMNFARVHRRRTYYWLLTGERTGPVSPLLGLCGFPIHDVKEPSPRVSEPVERQTFPGP